MAMRRHLINPLSWLVVLLVRCRDIGLEGWIRIRSGSGFIYWFAEGVPIRFLAYLLMVRHSLYECFVVGGRQGMAIRIYSSIYIGSSSAEGIQFNLYISYEVGGRWVDIIWVICCINKNYTGSPMKGIDIEYQKLNSILSLIKSLLNPCGGDIQ